MNRLRRVINGPTFGTIMFWIAYFTIVLGVGMGAKQETGSYTAGFVQAMITAIVILWLRWLLDRRKP